MVFWISFSKYDKNKKEYEVFRGLSIDIVDDTLQKIVRNEELVIRLLEVEFWSIPLFQAHHFGLSQSWVEILQEYDSK